MNHRIIFPILLLISTPGACKQKTAAGDAHVALERRRKTETNSSRSGSRTDSVAPIQPGTDTTNELRFLYELKGRYPYDVKLLNNPILKRRLTKLLGPRYRFLKQIWQVETPIEISDDLFYAWAMQAHSGGDPGAVIMADLAKNILYVGIREDGHCKIYSENGQEAPKRMLDWSREQ